MDEISRNNITLRVDVPPLEILTSLADDLDRNELVEFIKGIDEEVADWDFTNALIEYFKEQEILYIEETKETENIGPWPS